MPGNDRPEIGDIIGHHVFPERRQPIMIQFRRILRDPQSVSGKPPFRHFQHGEFPRYGSAPPDLGDDFPFAVSPRRMRSREVRAGQLQQGVDVYAIGTRQEHALWFDPAIGIGEGDHPQGTIDIGFEPLPHVGRLGDPVKLRRESSIGDQGAESCGIIAERLASITAVIDVLDQLEWINAHQAPQMQRQRLGGLVIRHVEIDIRELGRRIHIRRWTP